MSDQQIIAKLVEQIMSKGNGGQQSAASSQLITRRGALVARPSTFAADNSVFIVNRLQSTVHQK